VTVSHDLLVRRAYGPSEGGNSEEPSEHRKSAAPEMLVIISDKRGTAQAVCQKYLQKEVKRLSVFLISIIFMRKHTVRNIFKNFL
jgi:hypothetical protein